MTSLDLVAEHVRLLAEGSRGAGPGRTADEAALTVLVGPDSDVGRALLRGRSDLARTLLERWRRALPQGSLVVEVFCHQGPPGSVGSRRQAAGLLALADETGVPDVLTAAVRHGRPEEAITADVLDAARRLVVLDTRHLDQVTTLGHLASTGDMLERARLVCGDDGARAAELVRATLRVAGDCVLDPRTDLGLGSVQLPEPGILDLRPGRTPQAELTERCRSTLHRRYPDATAPELARVEARLDDELQVVGALGYPTYFLTVATVCDLIREMDGRVAARGSGAGSLINYLLGISGVDPIRYDLLMERFCSPLRAQLPDIDVDVESDRRTAIYERILDRFGGDRVTCVSMMDTYRVRHAVRDVGAALGMPPIEVDAIAKAFPHVQARDARSAIADLPELRASGLDAPRLQTFFDLVERVDGLPRHVALHPCGVVLSNSELLDRTPVEASWLGFPMSHFDKDDVEAVGFLKLDVLGIRMQSAMAHAVAEVERVDGIRIDLDDRSQVPLDDEATFRLIRSTHTLGCFQIESPGQRELIGKFGPESFEDIVIDISLFRPGPVKSDMITPFLRARQGWAEPDYLHETLVPALRETAGVVVFHEQVLRIVAETAGVSLAQADEVRRAMGSPDGQAEVEAWWRPAAAARGYAEADVDRIWEVLRAFASFGFCKAHAAAFALPTYQSAWLKAHHPAAFLAGVLTHDPGMYPKRLVLDDARSLGIAVLGLDVNASGADYRIERVAPREEPRRRSWTGRPDPVRPTPTCPTGGPTAFGCPSPTSRGSARPRCTPSSPDSPTRPSPTSGTGPAPPDRPWSGSSWRERSTRSTDSAVTGLPPGSAAGARSPAATCCCTSPSWSVGPGPRPGDPAGGATAPDGRRPARPPAPARPRPAGCVRTTRRAAAPSRSPRRMPAGPGRPPPARGWPGARPPGAGLLSDRRSRQRAPARTCARPRPGSPGSTPPSSPPRSRPSSSPWTWGMRPS